MVTRQTDRLQSEWLLPKSEQKRAQQNKRRGKKQDGLLDSANVQEIQTEPKRNTDRAHERIGEKGACEGVRDER